MAPPPKTNGRLLLVALCSLAVAVAAAADHACPVGGATDIHPCVCQGGNEKGLRISCRRSNLASISVGLRRVRRPISALELGGNSFRFLRGPLLRWLSVTELTIEDTPVSGLEPAAFSWVNGTLRVLRLVNTELRDVPPALRLNALEELVVNGSGLTEAVRLPGLGGLLSLSLVRQELRGVPDLSGQAKLRRLDLSSNRISALRPGVFRNLRNVEFLDVSSNLLEGLDSAAFRDLGKLIWLNVSRNLLARLDGAALARNTLLRVLRADGNLVDELRSRDLRAFRQLRRLTLDDNHVARVEAGAFAPLRRIATLRLARNRLPALPARAFGDLRYLEELDLSGNNLTALREGDFSDLFLVSVDLSGNSISLVEVGSFRRCANLSRLDLSRNDLRALPRGSLESSDVGELLLAHNRLASARDVPFGAMPGLLLADLSHNAIEELPKGALPALHSLHTVDLSHNRLRRVDPGSLAGLAAVRKLLLSHNELESLSGATFGALSTLLLLDLSHNRLGRVSRGSFSRLASLRTLDLSHNSLRVVVDPPPALGELQLAHNHISRLAPRSWPQMNSLLTLDLGHNELGGPDSLPPGAFDNLLVLRDLVLRGNGLSRVPSEALQGLKSVQRIDLEGNRIARLSGESLGDLPVLLEARLGSNGMRALEERPFERLRQLQTLDLSRNELRSLTPEAFRGLTALTTLDLSHNELRSIDNGTSSILEHCLSLEQVSFSHNRLDHLTPRSFPRNPYVPYRLRHVDLSFNLLSEVGREMSAGTSGLRSLNLSHNEVISLGHDALVNLTELTTLDLSHNELSTFPLEALSKLPVLTDLSVAHNNLTGFPGGLPTSGRLRRLDARGNRLRRVVWEVVAALQDGVEVFLEGNPLLCDCALGPLLHLLKGRSDRTSWRGARCAGPQLLQGHALHDLDEDQLECPEEASRVLPSGRLLDVRFRQLSRTDASSLEATWFVSTHADVGGFRLTALPCTATAAGDPASPREEPSEVVIDLEYDAREHIFRPAPCAVCIRAIDSLGAARRTNGTECRQTGAASRVLTSPSAIAIAISIVSSLISCRALPC